MTSKPAQAASAKTSPRTPIQAMEWDEIGQVCLGLAFAMRPLRAATRGVTEAYDLGPRGAWILSLIDAGHVFPRDLAAAFRIGRSLITAELTRLTSAGLIDSRPGSDRRRTELALTPAGLEACQKVRREMKEAITTNLAAYSAEEIHLFIRMLSDVRGDSPTIPGVD